MSSLHSRPRALGKFYELSSIGDGHLRGGRRRRRARVRHKISDRYVYFVPHRRDDGHRRLEDRPRDRLLVERPQVFERAAAAGDDQRVYGFYLQRVAIGGADRLGDLDRSSFPLDFGREEQHLDDGVSFAHDLEDIAQGCAFGRGDDPDAFRELWDGLLEARVEEPFGLEPRLQSL
jgi:hypothetical protein